MQATAKMTHIAIAVARGLASAANDAGAAVPAKNAPFTRAAACATATTTAGTTIVNECTQTRGAE